MGITLKGIIGDIVPVFSGLLPGPLGPMVTKLIGDALGTPVTSQADIDKALAAATPEQIIALKDKEHQFVLDFKQKDIDLEALANQDRASARSMLVATHSKTPGVLAAVAVGGFVAVLGFLSLHEVPATNRDIIVAAVGVLGAQVVSVYQFHFGSSSGSQKKDETISSMATTP